MRKIIKFINQIKYFIFVGLFFVWSFYSLIEKNDYHYADYNYWDGYQFAESNNIDNFNDCQDEFGVGEAEDGCNEYVKESYSGYESFDGYECTEDCGGHEAGYEWAEENDISDVDDCGGYSNSFIEGCEIYVEELY